MKRSEQKNKSRMLQITLLVLILTLAGITAGIASGRTCKLQGWDISLGKWSTGNISDYSEGEYIPVKLTMEDLPKNTTISVTIKYDYLNSHGIKGIEELMTEGDYYSPSAERNFSFGVNGAQSFTYTEWKDGGNGYIKYDIRTGNSRTVEVLFGAKLALGSHLWNGSTIHIAVESGCSGERDLPISVRGIIYHEITVDKSANQTEVYEGSIVSYTITIHNNGNSNEVVTLKDLIPHGLDFIEGSSSLNPQRITSVPEGTLVEWDITIQQGRSLTISYDALVKEGATSDLTNIATVYSKYLDPISDSFTIYVKQASVKIEKRPVNSSQFAHEGDTVDFYLLVTNTGEAPLYNLLVTDGSYTFTINNLLPGETTTLTCSFLVPTGNHFVNTATVVGYTPTGIAVSDSASYQLQIIHPSVSIEKVVSKGVVHEGETVTFTITVTNTGDTPLYNIRVTDGDRVFEKELLNPQESVVFTYEETIDDDLTNTASVEAEDGLGFKVSGSDSESVDVIHPSVSIEKVASSETVYVGETITYTITIRNTGDVTVSGVIRDSNGQEFQFNDLEPGESISFTYTVVATTTGNLTNYAVVEYYDILETPFSAETSTTVQVNPQEKPLAKIRGVVFLDSNRNGIYDNGEALIPGITVKLYNAEGNLIASVVTAADGSYEFSNLEPGTYRVSIDLPIEYELTTNGEVSTELEEGSTVEVNFGLIEAPVLPFTPETTVLPFTGIDPVFYLILAIGISFIATGLYLAILGLKI